MWVFVSLHHPNRSNDTYIEFSSYIIRWRLYHMNVFSSSWLYLLIFLLPYFSDFFSQTLNFLDAILPLNPFSLVTLSSSSQFLLWLRLLPILVQESSHPPFFFFFPFFVCYVQNNLLLLPSSYVRIWEGKSSYSSLLSAAIAGLSLIFSPLFFFFLLNCHSLYCPNFKLLF